MELPRPENPVKIRATYGNTEQLFRPYFETLHSVIAGSISNGGHDSIHC